jgi:DNA/RNA endonuclease G (NUC1)
VYTNGCPQAGYVNEHQWQDVERHVLKDIAAVYGDVQVWTGVFISRSHKKPMGSLLIPDYYWKVIQYNNNGQTVQEGWLAKNDATNHSTKAKDCVKSPAAIKQLFAQYYPEAGLLLDF